MIGEKNSAPIAAYRHKLGSRGADGGWPSPPDLDKSATYVLAIAASESRAAAAVRSMSSLVWASETNIASNCDGGR